MRSRQTYEPPVLEVIERYAIDTTLTSDLDDPFAETPSL